MDSPTSKVDAGVLLPGGIGTSEASLILHLYAELKLRRFRRLEVTVSDGRVVDVELTETIDRSFLPSVVR
jgi:hypothetical protein